MAAGRMRPPMHNALDHSFSVTSANIAVNNISLKTRFFRLHFHCRKCRCMFNHFYLMRLKTTEFGWNNARYRLLRHYYAVQGHSRSPIMIPIESS